MPKKTLRTRIKPGWVTKPPADTPENRLQAFEVDDNFLELEKGVAGIFITDAQPIHAEKNVVSIREGIPNQASIQSILTDDTDIRITIEWDRGTEYQGVPKVNGEKVKTFSNKTAGTYQETIDINIVGKESIECYHAGYTKKVSLVVDIPPVIELAEFLGNYPNSQTELKQGDTFSFTIDADSDFDFIEFENYGALESQTFSVTQGVSAIVNPVIANRGNSPQLLGAKVRIRKPSGVWSSWYNTENKGSLETIHVVNLNNQYPVLNITGINYPTGQQALKGSETATVNNTANHYDTISYTSPNSQLSIATTDSFDGSNVVTRIAGDYNVTAPNIQISANRIANNSTTTTSDVVNIANVPPTININTPANRLRSGGNDGTSIQNHAITIASNQNLLEAPSLDAPAGTWSGGFSGSGTTWTRTLQIHDNDTKGTYNFSSLLATGLSGIITTTIASGESYIVGGFVSRTITLPPFTNETNIGVEVTNFANMALSWSFKALTNKASIGTLPPIDSAWTISGMNINPTTIIILDTEATGASSEPSSLTIQETV